MFRRLLLFYVTVSIAMIATSLITGHRASTLSGKSHYMLTRTTVGVEEYVPPDNPTDAAFEAGQKDAGEEPPLTTVEKPCFVLGFADATLPVVAMGGIAIGAVWSGIRWRSHRRTGGHKTGPDV